MKNQLTSAIISLVLAATMTTPMYVFADEETVRTYEGEGYEVTYKVTGSWVGNQNVEITLANTGDEPILNWALKYDAHGEIGGLWNGTVYSNDSTKVIVKNAGYNYEIMPEQTVTFGYTLSGEYMEFPELVEMCTQRAEREPEKYSVKLDVVGDWQTGFIGNVTVENTGDTPLEAWRLSFDANFDIDTIWNAQMLSENEGAYVIANDVTTTPIGVGESKTFGFKASKENDVVPEIAVTALSEVVINDDYATIEVPENDLDICAYATYSEDNNALELFWSTNHENGTFEVMQSVDGNDFVNAVTLENEYSYSYPIVAEFDKLYFKVKQTTNDGLTAESPVIYVENTENGYAVNFIDSDDDMLPDFLEEIIGTDISDPDTDKDGLTDYQEYYVLGTDPLVFDSVEPGVSDSDADNDGDGLSNKRELEIGTKPFNPDSDDDGLTDGEEENTYGTNPLKYDTDDDGISDGDEITIGTDPLSPYTNGVADTERTFVQTINADDEILEEINTEYNPYELSLEITAAGNAHSSLTVQESGYSEAIFNGAILGACPELVYDNACKVDEVVVKFKVNDEFVSNEGSEYADENEEFAGIKRYNIFRFFEEDNILLPVKTEVDAQNNTLSARTTDLGTYCLIDMEVFLQNIVDGTNAFNEENKTAGSNPTTTLAASTLGMYAVTTSSASRVKPKLDYDDEFNVVFMYDIGAEGYSEFYKGVIKATNFMFTYSEKANVYFIQLEKPSEGTSYSAQCGFKDDKLNYAFHDSSMRDSHFKASSSESKDSVVISDALETVGTDATFIDTSLPTLCFSFFSDENAVYRAENGYELLDGLSDNVFVSLIGEFDFTTYAGGFALDMYHQTHGKYFYLSGLPLGDELIKYIYSVDEVPEVTKEYPIITSAGLEKVELDAPITADYFEAAKHLKDGMAAREDFTDYADTDIDGLYDFEEIKLESGLIELKDLEVDLPTFEECMAKYPDKYFYVESGLERYYTESTLPSSDVQKILRNTRVLPINSDPTREDSDGDGYFDNEELLHYESNPIENEIYTYYLSSDYIYIDKKIENESSLPSRPANWYYGGDQRWFEEEKGYEIIDETGCGLIAMGDVCLYLSKINKDYNSYMTDCVKTTCENYSIAIPKYIYLDYIKQYNDKYINLKMKDDWLGQKYKLNNIDGKIDDYLNNYFEDNSINIKAIHTCSLDDYYDYSKTDYSTQDMQKSDSYKKIKKSISDDMPVIIGIGPGIDDTDKVPIYYKENDYPFNYCTELVTDNHYVTITGIIVDKVQAKKYPGNAVAYKISTWGERDCYVFASDLLKHRFNGSIINRIENRISNDLIFLERKNEDCN